MPTCTRSCAATPSKCSAWSAHDRGHSRSDWYLTRERRIDGRISETLSNERFKVRSPGQLIASFDAEALTGHPRRLRTGEVSDTSGDIVGYAGTSEGLLR